MTVFGFFLTTVQISECVCPCWADLQRTTSTSSTCRRLAYVCYVALLYIQQGHLQYGSHVHRVKY